MFPRLHVLGAAARGMGAGPFQHLSLGRRSRHNGGRKDASVAPDLPGEMPALRMHEPDGPESLVFETAPTPTPGTGDVLVEVHAASFTPTELTWESTFVD